MLASIAKLFLHQLTVLCDHCLHIPSFARDVCKRCMYNTVPTRSSCSDKTCSFAIPAAYVPHVSSPSGAANWTTASLMLALSVAHDIKSRPSLRLSCWTDWSHAQWYMYSVLDEGLTFLPGCGCFTCPSRVCTVAKNVKKEQHWN